MKRHAPLSSARAGAALPYLLALVAALALAAGLALPTRAQRDDALSRRRTERALRALADAGREYFRDALAWPASLAELETSSGAATWSGPYVRVIAMHAQVDASTNQVDGWGRAIATTHSGGTWTLRSSGANGSAGDADDVVLAIEAGPLRAELTLERMDVLNRSIREYNDAHPATGGSGHGNGRAYGHDKDKAKGNAYGHDDGGAADAAALPSDLGALLAVLVAQGYLPSASGYATDAWGDALAVVVDAQGRPSGVTSVHCPANPVFGS